MRTFVLLPVILAAPVLAQTSCLLRSDVRIAPGFGPGNYHATDLDLDGDIDLLLVGSTTFAVASNDGRGGLADPVHYFPPPGANFNIAVGDVDRDGDPDVFVTRYWSFATKLPTEDVLFLNDGRGKLTLDVTGRFPPVKDASLGCAMADVDGDGALDIVVGSVNRNRLYLNDGTGRFRDVTATHMPLDQYQTAMIRAADLDGDRDQDLVLLNDRQPVGIYLNDGTGRFRDSRALHAYYTSPMDLEIGDVDRDGDIDIAVVNSANVTYLFLNDGKARFSTDPASLPPDVHRIYIQVEISDVDDDGWPDLILGHTSRTKGVRVLLNDGRGRFRDSARCASLDMPYFGSGLGAADMDGDGDADLVVVYQDPNKSGARLLASTGRHVDGPATASPGTPYPLLLWADPGHRLLVGFGLGRRDTDLGPFGKLVLDPSATIFLPMVTVPASRIVDLRLPIPNLPILVGRSFWAQGLDVDPVRPDRSHVTNWMHGAFR